ncbi:MAG: tRNA (adenosine(37)-N6)-threonylcarbamoyltransferase complex ATPase subunit type 1 TsaE [Clostridia bacterium]|nr:tRNA (adenosine(37)-N6)-threonylcarbamoyltransferase complex ATPase subunit type 1 TsaE [Clostridia bacterium]
MEMLCKSAEDTVLSGFEFGKKLKKGDVVCLIGDLGAGKTTFTKGIAKALNTKYEPVSPTFSIVHDYGGDIPLYHFDLYRLTNENDLMSIDFDSYIFSDGICVIEWPDLALDLLENYYTVEIKYSGNMRTINIKESE